MRPHPLLALYHDDPETARTELCAALDRHRGNVTATAASLSVSRKQLHLWLRSWGLVDWLALRWPSAERIGSADKHRRSEKSTGRQKKVLD